MAEYKTCFGLQLGLKLCVPALTITAYGTIQMKSTTETQVQKLRERKKFSQEYTDGSEQARIQTVIQKMLCFIKYSQH